MAPLGPTAFALLAWGSIALVLVVFAYEIYAVAAEVRGTDADADGG